ncbi:heat shock factor-binding protein 1-like protein 1 isoform X2 [Dendrobates tinctorius]|uniref:heat shock factor-binding protein 1-like protein 1 isoform X2 n=1 Tax=Dendrobates tinctorius TaxID=92724 RepID=UPI003CCA19BF
MASRKILPENNEEKNTISEAENLLKKLQERFQSMSDQLTERMEEMGSNIDKLQNDVSDLMTQAGIDNTDEVVH